MLVVNDLKKYYGKTKAVDGISFSIYGGEIVALLGANGAGKSTTLKAITGLLRLSGGEISICGIGHRQVDARKKVALVPETPDLYEALTVWEHMRFIAYAYELLNWEDYGKELLSRFELWDKRDELGINLSKGMKQKLIISCALLHHPEVLLFDEPLTGLDPKAIRELKEIFLELRRGGKAILISTHMLDTVERFCDRVIVMKSGVIVVEGTVDELKAQINASAKSTLEDVFIEVTGNVIC